MSSYIGHPQKMAAKSRTKKLSTEVPKEEVKKIKQNEKKRSIVVYEEEPSSNGFEEYLDVFDDEETYRLFCKKIEKEAFSNIPEEIKCPHLNITEKDDTKVCNDCGVECEVMSYEPEWRYYGPTDNRITKDPSRSHQVNIRTKSIDKTLRSKFVPESIRLFTYKKYLKIVGDETSRGTTREAIIAACLLHAYRENGDIRTAAEIRALMGNLEKKRMTDGLRRYYEVFPEDATKHVKAEDLIKRVLIKTGIDYSHYQKIMALCRYLNNTSKILNHSNPQSVASAIVFLYLCMFPKYKEEIGMTKAKFAEKVKLSDITVSKLAKEARSIVSVKKLDI